MGDTLLQTNVFAAFGLELLLVHTSTARQRTFWDRMTRSNWITESSRDCRLHV